MGYLVATLLGAVILGILLYRRYDLRGVAGRVEAGGRPFQSRCRFHRFRRPLPALFLVCAALAFIGGTLYAPNNYDALTYRFPRVLHWLAEGRWHWIITPNLRMNIYSPGIEWLTAPLFLLTRSDRFFFLLNFIPYLLLPGLIFSSFRQLGVNARVNWQWMWLIPCGYCFVLQAASMGNDSFGAVYCLVAVDFALRAARKRSLGDLFVAITAVALTTGAKGTNLPLLLPMSLAFLPALKLWKRHWMVIGFMLALALVVSFIPQAVINHLNAGHWAGDPLDTEKVKIDSPVWGVIGNAIIFIQGNFAPPIFPFASLWNSAAKHWLSLGFFVELMKHYRRFMLTMTELPNEEGCGIGFGVSALFVWICVYCGMRRSRLPDLKSYLKKSGFWIGGGAIFGFAFICAKLGAPATARYGAAYYPLMFVPFLLLPGNSVLVRTKTWKFAAAVCAASALIVVVLTPSRPLWPYETLSRYMAQRFPNNRLVQRTATVYSVYGKRADNLASLRKYLPEGAGVVGFMATGDDTEISMWRPFGSRKVVEVISPEQLESSRRECPVIVASTAGLTAVFGKSVEAVCQEHNGRILGTEKIITKVQAGVEDWYVIQLNPM
ncbi:MAG: hypothetical protein WCH43_11530 [Verrucomicrobiota bacterium]